MVSARRGVMILSILVDVQRRLRLLQQLNSRWVVGQVEEEGNSVKTAVLLKVLLEEASSLHVDTHRGEDDGEVVLVVVVYAFRRTFDKTCLSTDLRCDLVVWQTGSREDGNLLSSSDRVCASVSVMLRR